MKAQDGAKDTGLPLSEEGLRRSSRKRLYQLQALLESPSGSQAPQNCQQVDKRYEISDSAGTLSVTYMECTQDWDRV